MKSIKYILFVAIFFNQSLSAKKISKLAIDGTVDDLIYIIKKENITNIDEALKKISNDYFRFDRYMLFFNSFSPQPSSPEFPRVILFGENDHLRIGFNHKMGDVKDFEIIQWREKEKKWEFREIKFENNKAIVSGVDPPVCLGCHGERRMPAIDRLNKLAQLNIFAKKIDKSKFEKHRQKDPVYSRLKYLGL